MKGLDFPMPNTKAQGSKDFYDLSDFEERQVYFHDKVGDEISALKDYMRDNTFITYMLGKKQAGKGTYTKLLAEIFGSDIIKHISVGDLVRAMEVIRDDENERKALEEYLNKNYRGFVSIEEAIDAFMNRNTSTLLPTEFVLTLVKREIEKAGRVNLFIDGFPRNMDQVTYSLYFRELINYRDDPDIFLLLDVPEAIIDTRIKYRRVCPKCQTSRNLWAFPTKEAGYDKEKDEFYLICDNPECTGERMVGKEGDDLGIQSIKDRLEMDDELIRKVFGLHGVPKIFIRNSVPAELAHEILDDYEITPRASYKVVDGKVVREDAEWKFLDDNGVESYSVTAPAGVVSWIKQLHKVLILGEH